MFKCLII